jgi:hypothetical protein
MPANMQAEAPTIADLNASGVASVCPVYHACQHFAGKSRPAIFSSVSAKRVRSGTDKKRRRYVKC